MATGGNPSVAEVADAARVSRRTAYRYFPTAEQLKTEAILEVVRAQIDQTVRAEVTGADIERRIDRLVDILHRITVDNESLFRQVIRFTIDRGFIGPGEPPRPPSRLEFIEQALLPLKGQLKPSTFNRLVRTLAVVMGIEAHLVLRDICGLEPNQIRQHERWAARALLAAAIAERR